MLDRLLVLAVVVVIVVSGALVVRAWSATRRQRLITSAPHALWQTLATVPDGRPTLVSFSSQSCAACHTAQAPAVRRAEAQLGVDRLRVIEVDAARQPAVASAFGVMTVPSTVLLDAAGGVLAINQGFTPTTRLVGQLQQG